LSLYPAGWNEVEENVFDLATRLKVAGAPTGWQSDFIQREHSRSQQRAPQGYGMLQAWDGDGFIENGGAIALDRHHLATAAHCVAKLKDGVPVPFWNKLTISLGCEDRDIQKNILAIDEAWVHSDYQEYRGGFAKDIAILYTAAPIPDAFVMKPRKFSDYHQKVGELVSAPNMGSSGTAGNRINGELHQFLHDDVMKVSGSNPVYLDMEPVNGIVRPGASGGPGWDADGADEGALAGIVSHVDQDYTRATMMPAKELLLWFYKFRARRDYAAQMGKLSPAA